MAALQQELGATKQDAVAAQEASKLALAGAIERRDVAEELRNK